MASINSNRKKSIESLARILVCYDEGDLTDATTEKEVDKWWRIAGPEDRAMRRRTAKHLLRLWEKRS